MHIFFQVQAQRIQELDALVAGQQQMMTEQEDQNNETIVSLNTQHQSELGELNEQLRVANETIAALEFKVAEGAPPPATDATDAQDVARLRDSVTALQAELSEKGKSLFSLPLFFSSALSAE